MKKLITSLLMTLLMIFHVQAYATDDALKNIYETAKTAGNFQSLLAALDKTSLDETFKKEGSYTLFAPTDDAINEFLNEKNLTVEELLSHPSLAQILKYHVVEGKYLKDDILSLSDGAKVKTLSGDFITVSKDESNVTLNEESSPVAVESTDILASNGVIHVIDAILIPDGALNEDSDDPTVTDDNDLQSIYEIAKSADNFTILVAAIEKADLRETFSEKGDFTVFAPTDEAFEKFLEENELSAENLLDHPNLKEILQYHVVNEQLRSTEIIKLNNGSKLTTLQKNSLTVTISNDELTVNNSRVIDADILASNGVIHSIDTVLIPPSLANPEQDQDDTKTNGRSLRGNLKLNFKQSGTGGFADTFSSGINTNLASILGEDPNHDDATLTEDDNNNSSQTSSNSINFFQSFLLLFASFFSSFLNFLFKR